MNFAETPRMRSLLFILPGFLSLNCFAQNYSTKIPSAKVAGIEVGSKGVKLSVLEKVSQNDFKLVKDSSVNSDFISFNESSFNATLNALTGLYNYCTQQQNIPSADIATLISSGVKAQADKLGKNEQIKDLITEFKTKISEQTRVVDVVTVKQESILSHQGIIPNSERYTTFLIDIGSGNTKGGYFSIDANDFVMFQIPSGTKSVANSTEKNCGADCDFQRFKNQVDKVIDSVERKEIAYAVNASGAYPASTKMALSGGIAWATATLLFPERTNEQQIEVTYRDVNRFREGLIRFYKDIPDTNKLVIKNISNAKLSQIRMELQKVLNVFDVKSLLAGSSLMLRIMRQFEPVNGSKKFVLIKNGQVGWITGYVLSQKLNQ